MNEYKTQKTDQDLAVMSFGMSLYFHEFTSDVNLSIDFDVYIIYRDHLWHIWMKCKYRYTALDSIYNDFPISFYQMPPTLIITTKCQGLFEYLNFKNQNDLFWH